MQIAICNLIFTNPAYLVGGCLSAFVHKKYTKKLGLKVDIIVMVDKIIYEFKDELLKFYDEVILIELIELNISPEYNILQRYSNWIKYSVTKWEILNLTKWDKVLFIDIDMLPIKDDFYSILDMDVPALFFKHAQINDFNKKIDKKEISDKSSFRDDEWNKAPLHLNKSIDASLVLIKPDNKLYLEYLEFLKLCGKNKGYAPLDTKGVDETTLLLFFLYYKKMDVYQIPYEFGTVLYDETYKYNINNIKCVNFMSDKKPWTILSLFQWNYEYIWHKIAKKALIKSDFINKIYIDECIKQLINYSKNFIDNGKVNYNCLKNENTKNDSVRLLFFLYNLNYDGKSDINKYLSFKQIEKIIIYSNKINNLLEKKDSPINYSILSSKIE